MNSKSTMQIATFAAGCFWGVQAAFQKLDGVVNTTVGYTGGHLTNPTYEDVCIGKTGHAEAIKIEFDPAQVSYQELLQVFFSIHDPTTPNRQGPDIGSQYRSAIFFHDPKQEKAAKEIFQDLEKREVFSNPIVTEIVPATEFFRAEEYHQKYFEKQGKAFHH